MLENLDKKDVYKASDFKHIQHDPSHPDSGLNIVSKIITLYSVLGTLFIAVLGLLGSLNESFIPMALSTAVSFILLGGVLLFMTYREHSIQMSIARIGIAVAALVALFASMELVGYILSMDLTFENRLLATLSHLGDVPPVRMSISTGMLFLLAALALIVLLLASQFPRRRLFYENLSNGLGTVVLVCSLIFCGVYLLGSPLLYGDGNLAPMPLTTALAFMLLGLSIVARAGEHGLTIRLVQHVFRPNNMPFSPRKRLVLLISVMIMVAGTSMALLLLVLYRHEFGQRKIQLLATAQSQTQFMKLLAEQKFASSKTLFDDEPGENAYETILKEYASVLGTLHETGRTMEFTLAQQKGDSIVFVLARGKDGDGPRPSVHMDATWAEPQRRALRGKAGTMVGLDYHGQMVLAAYDYIAALNLGVVVKIDVAEIRAPFIRAVIFGISITGIIILLGSFVFIWIGNPIIRRLERYTKELEKGNLNWKETENVLKESEERYRALFQQASDGIIFLSIEGKVIAVNESFARMHGYSVEEIMGMGIHDLDSPENVQMIPERMKRVMSGEVVEFESEHYHKDGHTVQLSVSSCMVSVGDKQYIQAFHHDISQRKQAELKRSLLETQLRQSQKLEAIETMAAGISHSFNNILQAQLLHAEIVQRQLEPDSKLRINMQHIINAGNNARDLVSGVLTFSRDRETLLVPIEMQHLVKHTTDLLRSIFPSRIKIETTLDMDAAPVIGDYTQIQQIILNLCNNALQAIGDADGLVRVSFKEIPASLDSVQNGTGIETGSILELQISDTGCGMNDEILEKIFDPFFTTKPVGQGTGLGLSVIHGIIEDMKGEIKVTSKEGHGSTFTVYFPAAQTQDPEKGSLDELKNRKWTQSVLVLEADPDIQNILTLVLEGHGFQVYTQSSTVEAIEELRLESGKYGLIITELSLWEMSGLEFSKKALEIIPHIPIILTSGNFDSNALKDCERLGIRAMKKPWNENDLLNEITALNLE